MAVRFTIEAAVEWEFGSTECIEIGGITGQEINIIK